MSLKISAESPKGNRNRSLGWPIQGALNIIIGSSFDRFGMEKRTTQGRRSGKTFRVELLLRRKFAVDSRGWRLQVIHSGLFSRSCEV